MTQTIAYWRRDDDAVVRSQDIAQAFPAWRGADERWLFISPHDDDIVLGAGLTFLAGMAAGAEIHAAIVTDGRMGYCRPDQKHTVAEVRAAEARASFAALGLPPERLRFLKFPDGDLSSFRGRRLTSTGYSMEVAGAVGTQNTFTHILRQIRPTRVFLATSTDLHPEHRLTHEEMLISLFHAQGNIWPELGTPIAEVPRVYEYAVYCDFPSPPNMRIEAPPEMLETKLAGIKAYASQEQIDAVIDIQRKAGPVEYLRELTFNSYALGQYHRLFAGRD